jgi:hypothetical protein
MSTARWPLRKAMLTEFWSSNHEASRKVLRLLLSLNA